MRLSFPKIPLAVLLVFTVLGSTLVILPTPVFASIVRMSPACGATIVEPPGTTVVLTGNIGPCSANGLIIGFNGITLNCAGHSITGDGNISGYIGIHLTSAIDVIVKNCVVSGFDYGIVVTSSSSVTLRGDKANGNGVGYQVELSSLNDRLTGNTANKNVHYGLDLGNAHSNTLTGNTANKNHDVGFIVASSSNGNTLTKNTANGNTNWGYYDVFTGSGTKGTANTYTSNICKNNGVAGSTPSGLGSPQA
ncbi:MAG: NosD domain-containing protein [Nitrososphaerales archaeon]